MHRRSLRVGGPERLSGTSLKLQEFGRRQLDAEQVRVVRQEGGCALTRALGHEPLRVDRDPGLFLEFFGRLRPRRDA